MQILEEQTSTLNYDPHRNDDMESDIVEIGLRAEYAEYLANKNNPQISFLEWCDDIHPAMLSDEDKKQISEAREAEIKNLQAKLDNWAKGSAIVDACIAENERAAQSTLEGAL